MRSPRALLPRALLDKSRVFPLELSDTLVQAQPLLCRLSLVPLDRRSHSPIIFIHPLSEPPRPEVLV